MKVQKFHLYLAGFVLLLGGSIAWASTSGPNALVQQLQTWIESDKDVVSSEQDSVQQVTELVIDLSCPLITESTQLSSPCSDSSEGQHIEYLIDGDASTFWHSDWHGQVDMDTHYFQVELPENVASLEMAFRFIRRNCDNDHTIVWSVRGTNDFNAEKDNCELIATISTPFNSPGETLTSSAFNPQGYKYLRFYSEEQSGSSYQGRKFFHLAEFQLYPFHEAEAGPLPVGQYYFKAAFDADSDGTAETYFLGGANNWGTRAALIPNSVLWTLEHVSDNIYIMDSYQSNGGQLHYLGDNAYVDANPCEIFFTKNEEDGTFVLSLEEEGNYLKFEEMGFHNLPALNWGGSASEAIKFNVVSKNAAPQSGDNVTYMIQCANFDTNNRYRAAWKVEADNYNLNGGTRPNRCAESWHSAFNICQTLENVPNGLYVLGAQAAVRDDANLWDGENYPVVYINEASIPFNEMENRDYVDYLIYDAGGDSYTRSFNPSVENSAEMSDFSQLFAEGQYALSIPVLVTDNTITLGVRGTRTNMWAMFDNFSLVYYGYTATAGSFYLKDILAATTLEEIGICNITVKEKYETTLAAAKQMAEAGTASYQECVEQGEALTAAYNELQASIAAYESVPDIIDDLNNQFEIITGLNNETLMEQAAAFIRDFAEAYQQRTLTTEDITSVLQNFKAIVSEGLTTDFKAGDDLTLLITNPDFSQKGKGWMHNLSEIEPPMTLETWTSPRISDSQRAEQTYTFESGQGMYLSFNYTVSSEGGYDYLSIYLDGNQIVSVSGEESGTYSNPLSVGSHTLYAVYSKDGSSSSGADNGTIYDITVGIPEGSQPSVNYSYGVAEVYHNPFDFYQIIPSMPAGVYRLSCTAFNRVEGRHRSAKLYGGISEERLKLITDESSLFALFGDTQETAADGSMFASSTGNWPYDSRTVMDGQVRFTPNSMEGGNVYFNTLNPETQQPYYSVSTQIVLPQQGDLRIGIKCESNTEWVLWDNFTLQYVGNNEDLLAGYVDQLKSYLSNTLYYMATLREEATALVAAGESDTLSVAGAYIVIGEIGNLIDVIKTSMEAYATLTEAIVQAEDRLETVPNVDEEVKAELQSMLETAKDARNAGSYTNDEAKAKATEILTLSLRLQTGYLYIETAEAGTLGDLVLDFVENFSDVKGLTVVGPMNADDLTNVGRMTSLEKLDLSEAKLYRIENYQFQNRDLLQVLRLPKVLTYLGYEAFGDCDGLTSVTISGSINEMGSSCFYGCDALEEVIIEEGVTKISSGMFSDCYRLSKLTLPISLTSINESAFYNCYSLALIPLPGNLKTIENYAFHRDNRAGHLYNGRYEYDEYGNYLGYRYDTIPNLCPRQIEIPASVTNIGYCSFYNFDGLESVTLNEGLTSIGSNAFYNTAISTATFPSTLRSIGYAVFNSGTHYTSIALNPPTANDGCPVENPDTLYVPMLVTKAYKQVAGWDRFKIVGINVMPNDMIIRKQMNLDFAQANIPEGYKPNMYFTPTNVHQCSSGTPSELAALEVHNSGMFSVGYLEMNYSTAQTNYLRYHYRDYYGQAYYTPQYNTIITDGSMRADNITIRVHINDGHWSFISLPYDVRVGDITCETAGANWIIRRYDGEARAAVRLNETWVNMGEDDILEAGKGYIMHCCNTGDWYGYLVFRFPALNTANKNLIFSAANRTIELEEYQSEYAHNRSWNLVGNPYPAYMEIGNMNLDAPITVWNGRDGYLAYSPIDDYFVLSPGEAFFVQRPLDQSSVTFTASGRKSYYGVTGTSNRVRQKIRQSNSNRSVFNLFLSNGEQIDRTRVVINPQASMDYEVNCDAAKFAAMDATATQLYSTAAGVQYAINERPLSDGTVQLAAHFGKTGTYTITLETTTTESVILVDEETGTTLELNGSEGYTFNAEAGNAENRFRLMIGGGQADSIESLDADELDGTEVFTLDGKRLPANRVTTSGIYLIKKNGIVRKISVK